jgi:hypothetical protein
VSRIDFVRGLVLARAHADCVNDYDYANAIGVEIEIDCAVVVV